MTGPPREPSAHPSVYSARKKMAPSRRRRSSARRSGSACSIDLWGDTPPVSVIAEAPASRSGLPVLRSWPSCSPAWKLILAHLGRNSDAREVSGSNRRTGLERTGTMKVTQPEDFHRSYTEAFNSGDIAALRDHYERDATFVPQPGQSAFGHFAIGEALQCYESVGKMAAETRYC